jgi:hypothetical protein
MLLGLQLCACLLGVRCSAGFVRIQDGQLCVCICACACVGACSCIHAGDVLAFSRLWGLGDVGF